MTAIPEVKYDEAQDGPLQKSNTTLKGPNGQNLIVKQLINAELRRDQSEMEEKVYIVKVLQNALVGRPAIQALNLVARIETVHSNFMVQKFPELFGGLGTMQGEYHIKIKAEANPFVLTAPRRIAVPLQPKVKAELQHTFLATANVPFLPCLTLQFAYLALVMVH